MRDRAEEDARGLSALGAAIRTRRTEVGLTEGELAARTGIDPSVLEEVEDGGREPTWGDLRRIAQGVEDPLDSLLELAERLEEGAS